MNCAGGGGGEGQVGEVEWEYLASSGRVRYELYNGDDEQRESDSKHLTRSPSLLPCEGFTFLSKGRLTRRKGERTR